ncbi:MAG TPA: ABC transporter permease subunit [Thermoleophilia bacterium]
MLRDPFFKTLRDQARNLLTWGLGAVAYVAMLMAVYPSIRKSAGQLQGYIDNLPSAVRAAFLGPSGDFTSPTGYINTELLSWLAPIVFIAFAIGVAGRALAGEEEDGTLSLLLAYPVPRRRLALQKFAALAVLVSAIGVAFWASLAIATAIVGTPVGAFPIFEAVLLFTLLALAIGSVTLATGAATGSRSTGTAVGAGVAVAMYLLNTLAQINSAVHPYRVLSLFYYSGGTTPLGRGLGAVDVAVLVCTTLVFLAATVILFERRDIRV